MILLDDLGFADTSTFGGLAQTPTLDALVRDGLRYNNFNTAGMCSPTRAALLTGRNHHRVGFGTIADTPGQYAGYDGVWKKTTASIAEVLRLHGYSTAAFGKWHNTPTKEISPIGPFERWPTGLGFDYYYGFMQGAQNHWEPSALFRNTQPVEPKSRLDHHYHLTDDITDEAIRWVQTHLSLAPEKPYFLYFSPGGVHFPYHVSKEWIEKYRGKFDQGWDRTREEVFERQKTLSVIPMTARLTPRPQEMGAWSSLSVEQQAVYARQMEVYAAFIEHTDHEVGRLLQVVRTSAQAGNTLVLFIGGDNGGSPGLGNVDRAKAKDQLRRMDDIGSARHLWGLATEWAWASSTPFQWYKGRASHFGAVRNPLVVSFPGRIKDPGGLRTQFTHVTDIAATVYELTGAGFPTAVNGVKQVPLDGVSFASTLDDADAPSKHRVQYFEMYGNRAIYQDGWIAAARHLPGSPNNFAQDRWELYDVKKDYSQGNDVAAWYPDKLKALQELFDAEATRNDVYPLGGAGQFYVSPLTTGAFVYHRGLPRVMPYVVPRFLESHHVSVRMHVPDAGAQGVIVSYGGRYGGFVLYAKDGYVVYETNVAGENRSVLRANTPLPRGSANVTYEFIVSPRGEKRSGVDVWAVGPIGVGRLYIDGQLVGEGSVEMDNFWGAHFGSFGVGRAFGSPVTSSFEVPFTFTGTLEEVRIELP